MKKNIVIFGILVSAIFNCIAQPNPGFENWTTVYNYQTPDSWQTLNTLSMTSPPNPISAFKASGLDKHSGNFALKVKTIFINNNPLPDILDDSVGLAFTGQVIISPPSIRLGFPYTGRPEKMDFWSKYTPVGNDTGGARVLLLKWNGTSRDTIAVGTTYIPSTSGYTLFQDYLTYFSTELPDSAAIIFGSSFRYGRTRVGSTLYIDDVALSGWVGIDEQVNYANMVKIFPNPAKDNVTIHAQIDDASTVKVSDVSGKQVGVYKIQNYSTNINTGLFAEGIYFFEICDKKDNVLTKGKFNVVK